MKIKKNDKIIIIAGKHKGQKGVVGKILHKKERVIISGINMVKKHLKPSQQNPDGGIIEKEASIHISNIKADLKKNVKKPKAKVTKVVVKKELQVKNNQAKIKPDVSKAKTITKKTKSTGKEQ